MEVQSAQNLKVKGQNPFSGRGPGAGAPRKNQLPENKEVAGFKNLLVWQKSISFAKNIYQETKLFPREELYGITSQMRRAAVSISSNIAEGHRRWHPAEFKQHLNIALGSAAEIETQLILCHEINYLNNARFKELNQAVDEVCRMLVGLSKKIER